MKDILGSPCDTGSGGLGTGSCSLTLKPKNHRNTILKATFCYLLFKHEEESFYKTSKLYLLPSRPYLIMCHRCNKSKMFYSFLATQLTISADATWKFVKIPFEHGAFAAVHFTENPNLTCCGKNRKWFYSQLCHLTMTLNH